MGGGLSNYCTPLSKAVEPLRVMIGSRQMAQNKGVSFVRGGGSCMSNVFLTLLMIASLFSFFDFGLREALDGPHDTATLGFPHCS